MTEIVDEERMGGLLPPGDAAALAEALELLAADAKTRSERGSAAAVQAQSRFALPRMLEETEHLYERLLCPTTIPAHIKGNQVATIQQEDPVYVETESVLRTIGQVPFHSLLLRETRLRIMRFSVSESVY